MATPSTNPLLDFLRRYDTDWVLLVQEVLGANPDAMQQSILRAVCGGSRRVSIRSGHGVGKTTLLAWLAICHALTRFPQKTICTAPTSAQLFDALAAEMKAWFKKLPPALQDLFEIQTDQIKYRPAPEESFVAFRTSKADTPEAMAGVHSDNVLLIGDEASGIPQQVFEAAIGSMSGPHACTILAGNPVRSSGLFYDTHHKLRTDWLTFVISCVGHPRVTPDMVNQVAATYGESSNEYRVRVLGEFPLADDDTVIPADYCDTALTRDVTPLLVRPVWGLDVARYGSDATALAKRQGNTLMCPTELKRGYDTMQTSGWIYNDWLATPPSERPTDINVDSIGIGAGVVDRLLELGLPVRGINVSESPALGEQFSNLRAELWFRGRDWLGKKDVNLANDVALANELKGPRYKFTSSGKRQVESKEEMKKRRLDSPNRADAFLLTLASDAISASNGPTHRRSWNEPLKREIKGIECRL